MPESVNVAPSLPYVKVFLAGITLLPVLIRAVTGFTVWLLRDVTDVRVDGTRDTTREVFAVRATVPRVFPVVERGEDATAREDVFVRVDAEFVAEDIARDADVERFIVFR